MKILVYGAGNIGGLYAALLRRSGRDVSILARGRRLADLRDHGIQLDDAVSGTRFDVQVDVVERLDPEDAYDLVLVALPKDHVADVLPVLRASRRTPNVMFFGNNAAGPGELVDALGRGRVLQGFPGAAAVSHEGRLRYLVMSAREQPTTIGELDGSASPRIASIAEVLIAAGFPSAISPNMDAWLKTHVAEIVPSAGALYMAGLDLDRLARTRDALVLMVRAIREGYRVLAAAGVPVTPAIHRIFRWLPEPVLLMIIRRILAGDEMRIMIGHAADARAEMTILVDQLQKLAGPTAVPTPALDRLAGYLVASTEPAVAGAAELPLHWGGVRALGVGVTAVAVVIWRRLL